MCNLCSNNIINNQCICESLFGLSKPVKQTLHLFGSEEWEEIMEWNERKKNQTKNENCIAYNILYFALSVLFES